MKSPLFILSVFLVVFFVPIFQINADLPIKILLVPGHDDEIWGAQYGNTKEADMTLALATRIYNLLKKDKRFDVYITRDSGGYTKEFADYFANHEAEIVAFKENAKKEIKNKITNETFLEKESVPHIVVKQNTSIVLYGINKWANENTIDVVIHIHFNDYPRKNNWTIGKYKGFTIYMPDGQMRNSFESGQLAANIFIQLNKKYKVSDYEKELGGLIPDQKLIALGANETLNAGVRSVLVEYGYIYEKKFRKKSTRQQIYNDMATRTVRGMRNYFFNHPTLPLIRGGI